MLNFLVVVRILRGYFDPQNLDQNNNDNNKSSKKIKYHPKSKKYKKEPVY